METFEELIAPLPMDDFVASHWEKTFLHLAGEPGRFSPHFSLREVDRWLAASGGGNLFVTAPEGSDNRSQAYRPRDISLSSTYAAFTKGSSLILNPLEDWPSVQGLVRAVRRALQAEVSAEAYLLPRGAKTFPPFAAGYDLFILQVEGETTWQLHEFSLLQLNPSQKKNFKFPLEWYGRSQTPVFAEAALEPGHLLYIPRGMPHRALSTSGTSLHLNLNVTAFTWMDFLKVAVECAALHSQEIRRSLPPGFVESPGTGERMRETFAGLMTAFQEITSFDEVLAAVKRNRIKSHGFPADGHFARLVPSEELTAETEVERRDVLCHVDEIFDIDRSPRAALFFGHEQVTGPRPLRRAFEFIRDNPRFRVADLPGLDGPSRLVLVRRLIREGLLRQVAAKPVDQPAPVSS